ncbi:MAG: sialidase family protein, partial [Opitutaceae bacterium]
YIGWTVSTDNGGTWSSLQEIDVAPLVQPCGNGPLLRLPNGRLLAAFESYKHYDDPAPWSSRSAVILSEDNGRTWAKPLVVAYDPTHVLSFWDQNIQLLADGTLISLIWVDDRNRPGASEIYCSRSHDFGETWTTPGPIGVSGQHSKPLLLPDSRLLLFYVVRHGDSAIRIAISSDQGNNWRTNDDWLLYSQRANDLAALKDQGHGEYTAYLQGMGQWSFGWPSAVVLEDGQILASYYAGHGDRSSVYVRRLSVT